VWAHSEYVKLVRSLKDGKIFDQPPQTVKRYQMEKQRAAHFEWRFNNKCRSMPQGKNLRISLLAPALVHWSDDNWQTTHDTDTVSTGVGIHAADLPTGGLEAGRSVVFTFFWLEQQRWEGTNFSVNFDPE
jgi:glucoamylase